MTHRSQLTFFSSTLALTALLAPVPAWGQLPCQAPTQLIESQTPVSFAGFGRHGAVDGDTALVLSEDPVPSGAGPVDVHVLGRSPSGAWGIVQVLRLTGGSTAAPGTKRVHLDGDVAAVTFSCGPFSDLRMLERDAATGQWSEAQRLSFPGFACISTSLAGDRLVVGFSDVQEVRVYDRSASGLWTESGVIAEPAPSTGFSTFGSNVALSPTTLVVVDEAQRELHFFERDSAGAYGLDLRYRVPTSSTGVINVLGRALDIDAERLIVASTDGNSLTGSSVEFFRRAPLAPTRWSYEGALTGDPAGNREFLGFKAASAGGTLVTMVTASNDCGSGFANRVVLAREPGFLPVWSAVASVCPSAFGAVTFQEAVPLDYDGSTLLLGLASEDANGVTRAGRVALVGLPSVATDCDGNCVSDAAEIAACVDCDLNGNGRLDRCERQGARYCDPAIGNSSGAAGRLDVLGSVSVASPDLVGVASSIPANTFGFLISARAPAFVPGAGGSTGVLCIGGPAFGRFAPQPTGLIGRFVAPIDPQNLPSGPAPYAVQPGDSVFFQAWFRDGAGSNLTDAVAVTFGG